MREMCTVTQSQCSRNTVATIILKFHIPRPNRRRQKPHIPTWPSVRNIQLMNLNTKYDSFWSTANAHSWIQVEYVGWWLSKPLTWTFCLVLAQKFNTSYQISESSLFEQLLYYLGKWNNVLMSAWISIRAYPKSYFKYLFRRGEFILLATLYYWNRFNATLNAISETRNKC